MERRIGTIQPSIGYVVDSNVASDLHMLQQSAARNRSFIQHDHSTPLYWLELVLLLLEQFDYAVLLPLREPLVGLCNFEKGFENVYMEVLLWNLDTISVCHYKSLLAICGFFFGILRLKPLLFCDI